MAYRHQPGPLRVVVWEDRSYPFWPQSRTICQNQLGAFERDPIIIAMRINVAARIQTGMVCRSIIREYRSVSAIRFP